ncbi:type II toxin-antitoxin system mRNA interferase toxin, RelE/StbE family [Patescibacteria group bacterium]|nr:type II toxin-antitoxin system mRNA interferase toxin, RelE/StbE family [Patescibacteria group bacterium]
MKIVYHRSFIKRYEKLPPHLQGKVKATILILAENPFAPTLKNHALSGTMDTKRAVSVTGDLRIIYTTTDKHITAFLLDVGTHNQVYS